jgi:signal transduction histidine kinase
MQHIRSNSDWKQLYEAALLETDSSRLRERINVAREAILDRIEESLKQPIASERHAMTEALRHLRRLAEMAAPCIAA